MSSGFLIAKKSLAYLEHQSIKKWLDMTASLGIICCVAFLDVSRTKNGWEIFQTLAPYPTRFVFSLVKAPCPGISNVIRILSSDTVSSTNYFQIVRR